VSAQFAEHAGADGYALDAIEASRLVDRLIGEKKAGE
jgi:methanogenic corrinoid protein MtbC1